MPASSSSLVKKGSRKRQSPVSTEPEAATATKTTTIIPEIAKTNDTVLRFYDGAIQFRLRIAVSLLSCRTLLIKNIRADSVENPGLAQHEVSFLRLIDSMTNGTTIEINSTGTQLRFVPGIIVGGTVQHNCPVAESNTNLNDSDNDTNTYKYRSIGWYLEGILPLAPFGKEPLRVNFTGITDGLCHVDPSCDYWKRSLLPIMINHFQLGTSSDGTTKDFMGPEPPSISIHRRGAVPHGGGSVEFYCPIVSSSTMLGGACLPSIDCTDFGKIKRIRGHAISTKIVSSSTTARIAYSAKGLLHRLLPDVWVHTDVHTIKNQSCGIDPSVSLVLSAQSTTGIILTTECCLQTAATADKELPEDMGVRGAAMILDEVRKGGCIDTTAQSIVLLWMCLSAEDVSRIRIGTITSYSITALRLYQQVFGVTFKIKPDPDTKTILFSCLGTGYRNMARAST